MTCGSSGSFTTLDLLGPCSKRRASGIRVTKPRCATFTRREQQYHRNAVEFRSPGSAEPRSGKTPPWVTASTTDTNPEGVAQSDHHCGTPSGCGGNWGSRTQGAPLRRPWATMCNAFSVVRHRRFSHPTREETIPKTRNVLQSILPAPVAGAWGVQRLSHGSR